MSYEKQTWATGDVITAEKLNHMEDGIKSNGTIVPSHEATDVDGNTGDVYNLYVQIGSTVTRQSVCFVSEDDLNRIKNGDNNIRIDMLDPVNFSIIGYYVPSIVKPVDLVAPTTTSSAGNYLANDCEAISISYLATSEGSPIPAIQTTLVLPNTIRYEIVSM